MQPAATQQQIATTSDLGMSYRERFPASEGAGSGNGSTTGRMLALSVDDQRQPSSSMASTRGCRKVGFAWNGSTQIGMQIEAPSCNWVGAFGLN